VGSYSDYSLYDLIVWGSALMRRSPPQ